MFLAQAANSGAQDIPPEAAAAAAAAVAGVLIAVVVAMIVGWFVVQAVFSFISSLFLKRVPKEFRQMEPNMPWLMLIPGFHFVWIFFVVLRTVDSYKRYFASKDNTTVGDCGYGVGLGYCIGVCACAIGLVVPLLNCLAGPATLVLLIIYLVKMFGLRGQIPENEAAPQQ